MSDDLDEDACYTKLVERLHPDGLACPRCGQRRCLEIHRRHREPVLDYQCGPCRRVFNAWPRTFLQGTHRRPSRIRMILRGIACGEPTARMARELGCDRSHLLELRHRLQEHARIHLGRNPLDDTTTEADEMYRNAGKKGILTTTRPTRRGGGPTAAGATARSRPTDRRSPAWSVGVR